MNSNRVMKKLLTETNTFMQKHGANPTTDFPVILNEATLFDLYSESLSEGLEGNMREEFKIMSEQIRQGLLSESVYGYSPIAPLVMPIFRRMWPQLVVREALTVMPIDTPEVVHAFLMAVAKIGNNKYELPYLGKTVSTAQPFGGLTSELPPYSFVVPSAVNLLEINGFNNSIAHLARDVVIVGYTTDDGTQVDFYYEPDDDGNFSFNALVNGFSDYVSGHIDYFNGVVSVSSTRSGEVANKVTNVTVVGSITQAEEMMAPKISIEYVKVRLNAVDHEIQAEWTIQFEQDTKAYFGATRSIVKSYSKAA